MFVYAWLIKITQYANYTVSEVPCGNGCQIIFFQHDVQIKPV
jgi:hypothetical protein